MKLIFVKDAKEIKSRYDVFAETIARLKWLKGLWNGGKEDYDWLFMSHINVGLC